MEIFRTSDPAEAMRFAQECLTGQKAGLDVFFNESVFLQTGVTNTSDKDAARALGIPVWEARHTGGSIVCFPGDLSLCMIWRQGCDPADRWMRICARLLEERGAAVTFDHNDVLADGRKVASWANAGLPDGWMQTVAHFSVNVDLGLIRKLCTKPMIKTPGALSEYGITAEMLWGEIRELIELKNFKKGAETC